MISKNQSENKKKVAVKFYNVKNQPTWNFQGNSLRLFGKVSKVRGFKAGFLKKEKFQLNGNVISTIRLLKIVTKERIILMYECFFMQLIFKQLEIVETESI